MSVWVGCVWGGGGGGARASKAKMLPSFLKKKTINIDKYAQTHYSASDSKNWHVFKSVDVEELIVFVIEEMNICAAAFIDGMERLEEVPGVF